MQVQTTLTLFGASAVLALAIISCRSVLIRALDAMHSSELPLTRVMLIASWAFAVVATMLWFVSTAAVALHSKEEPAPQAHVTQAVQDGNERPPVPTSKDQLTNAAVPAVASSN